MPGCRLGRSPTACSSRARQSARAADGGRAGGEMRGGVDKVRAGRRIRRPAARSSRRGARYIGVTMIGALAAAGLAACGTSSAATGPATLNFYNFPDPSGAVQDAVSSCSAQSHGKYTISYNKLPTAADQQRLQMARRLAAQDSSLDILGLDVTWEAEFAQAGWIKPWTGTYRQQAPTWHGQLVAVPYHRNTQLLWYRSELVPNPPKTWAEMIRDAEQLANQGKPH